MRLRRPVLGLLALVAAAGLVAVAAPSAEATAATPPRPVALGEVASGTTDPAATVRALYSAAGFRRLVDDVTAQVHAQYPNARLFLLDGTSPSGLTTRLLDVTRWSFGYLAVSPDRHALYVSAVVDLPSRTAAITAVRSPVFGRTLPAVTMSPFEASVLARAAGYRQAYDTVWMTQPDGLAPRWTFFGDGARWSVDTVTREVTAGA